MPSSLMPAQQTVSSCALLGCGKALTRMRTRRVRFLLMAIGVRHGQVPDSGLGAARKGLGDDGAMTLGVVTLVAEKRDGAGGGLSQGIEQRALGGEVLTKVAEEAREITVFA